MRAHIGKIVLLFLALIVGLGGMGVAFAAWTDSIYVDVSVNTGSWCEGCTPGYWRNHPESWELTAYNTYDSFNETFDRAVFDPDITLLEAAWLGGGGINALARHAVAALLNASHPDVDYNYTEEQVIANFQYAFDSGDSDIIDDVKDDFANYNESGCPID